MTTVEYYFANKWTPPAVPSICERAALGREVTATEVEDALPHRVLDVVAVVTRDDWAVDMLIIDRFYSDPAEEDIGDIRSRFANWKWA